MTEPATESSRPNAQVLIVCTANVCRSPFVEGLLQLQLTGSHIGVGSAGTHAKPGSPPDPRVVSKLAQAGWRRTSPGARRLSRDLIAGADLVLCAGRAHRSDVVQAEPGSLRYTFLLTEFADLATVIAATEPEATTTGEGTSTFREWIIATSSIHRTEVAPRHGDSADIIDPFRHSERVFNRMIRQVDDVLPPITCLLKTAASSRRTVM